MMELPKDVLKAIEKDRRDFIRATSPRACGVDLPDPLAHEYGHKARSVMYQFKKPEIIVITWRDHVVLAICVLPFVAAFIYWLLELGE